MKKNKRSGLQSLAQFPLLNDHFTWIWLASKPKTKKTLVDAAKQCARLENIIEITIGIFVLLSIASVALMWSQAGFPHMTKPLQLSPIMCICMAGALLLTFIWLSIIGTLNWWVKERNKVETIHTIVAAFGKLREITDNNAAVLRSFETIKELKQVVFHHLAPKAKEIESLQHNNPASREDVPLRAEFGRAINLFAAVELTLDGRKWDPYWKS